MAKITSMTPEFLPESDLKKAIEDFYLPRHLVKAIYEIGRIPAHSQEGLVGVGFIDIADYTHLSKFLSPKENQILLNGLYTAFQMVLERYGGYLNKIEGDSMMFHFDDIIDKHMWNLSREERLAHIAGELFYTCVDMQRICILFNQANDQFLEAANSAANKKALTEAFSIIKSLRSKNDLASTLFAFFQIRIRIGANLGEVTIGNFGPDGSKHWDVIGLPVINAKRMESTAPVGGLRISAEFYEILEKTGIADEYFRMFREDAARLDGVYKSITKKDLYDYRKVIIAEKKGASYDTYSVQVSPSLPESICSQAAELLQHGVQGVRMIIEFIRYYRGNHYIINSLETMLANKGIVFRKAEILQQVFPSHSQAGKPVCTLSLYELLRYMDQYQDLVQALPEGYHETEFLSFDQHVARIRQEASALYEKRKKRLIQKAYFFDVIVPVVYASLEASILEYQIRLTDENDAELEAYDELEEAELLKEIDCTDG